MSYYGNPLSGEEPEHMSNRFQSSTMSPAEVVGRAEASGLSKALDEMVSDCGAALVLGGLYACLHRRAHRVLGSPVLMLETNDDAVANRNLARLTIKLDELIAFSIGYRLDKILIADRVDPNVLELEVEKADKKEKEKKKVEYSYADKQVTVTLEEKPDGQE